MINVCILAIALNLNKRFDDQTQFSYEICAFLHFGVCSVSMILKFIVYFAMGREFLNRTFELGKLSNNCSSLNICEIWKMELNFLFKWNLLFKMKLNDLFLSLPWIYIYKRYDFLYWIRKEIDFSFTFVRSNSLDQISLISDNFLTFCWLAHKNNNGFNSSLFTLRSKIF